MAYAPEFNRTLPAIFLAGLIALMGLHHWYAVTEGRIFVWVVFIAPALGALALGGILYPPLFWSIGPKSRDFPLAIRATGPLLALAGLAAGFWLARSVYGF